MDERTLRVLELDKVLHKLAERCATPMGKELVSELKPSSDKEEIVFRQAETSQCRQILEKFGEPQISGIKDIRPFLDQAQRGSLLEPKDLLTIASTLNQAMELKAFFLKLKLSEHLPFNPLKNYVERIGDHTRLVVRIRWSIGDDGQILDRASDELTHLRRCIETVKRRMQNKLNNLLSDFTITKFLQEPYHTIRDGRYCLPVKVEFRQEVKGIVHDKSTSGLTVFIEPEALVELGNELQALKADEQREIARILRGLTNEVVSNITSITQTIDAIKRIDFAFAKAKLSRDLKAFEPQLTEDGCFKLRQARHPLLHFQGFVIPIDIHLGEDFDVLVITGPNTGGKTVTLKTIGLLSLMTQCGLHIPASEGSIVSVFRQVFADIGDEQSIEQNLSTFSSHISYIAKTLKQSDERSLILLDEVGAGTDPTEGSALAKAILVYLHRRNAKVVCTTHHSELKHFAYLQPRFQNACMLFDPETLRPTYQLIIGIPGQSHALDIAKRLGVPTEIVREARHQLPQSIQETEKLIGQLSGELQAVEQTRSEWRRRLTELKKQEEKLHQREERLKQEEKTILENARKQADQLIRRLEAEVEETIKLLRKKEILPMEVRRKLRQLKSQFSTAQSLPSPERSHPLPQLAVGMTVQIRDTGVIGKVEAIEDNGRRIQVNAGGISLKISPIKLEVVSDVGQSAHMVGDVDLVRIKKMVTVPTELNLVGKRVDEALEALEKFLDDALLAGHKFVRIVHGKGTGKLRQAVHDSLRTHLQVKSFNLAPLQEGGDGVTVACLDV